MGHPSVPTQILTNGTDSCLRLIDIRAVKTLQTFKHPDFKTSHSWSAAALSPDGLYAGACSSSTRHVFVWQVGTGEVKANLEGHKTGACGFAWCNAGSTGQQVASTDRK